MALPTPSFSFEPPELQESISVVISHSVYGTLSWQPEEQNTTVMRFCVDQSFRRNQVHTPAG